MSVSAMVETYDMPMTDYNGDGDIPMGGSSSENWFQPLPHMDEDAHHYDAPSESLEVDMMFEETTTEYEMADEAEQLHDASVIDAELYDVTVHSTPLPHVQTHIVESSVARPQVSGTHDLVIGQPHEEGDRPVPGETDYLHSSDEAPAPDAPQAPLDMHASEYASNDPSYENHSEHRDTEAEHTGQSTNLADEAAGTGETRPSTSPDAHPISLQPEVPEGRSNGENDDKSPNSPAEAVLGEVHVSHETESSEQGGDEARETEEADGDAEDSDAEQPEPHASPSVYLQAPPIFLSLQVTSTEGDQPDFVLFNLPGTGSHETEEPLLLLQHHPQLFYEPVSAVFDAFRREEYFSHLEELSEAEMALNAHELQLVISEDNIYAREVSLQDLYAMHQGVGLPGHLRLTLQSIVPRFIARYNHLRDQITRLVLTNEEDAGQYALPTDDEEGHLTQIDSAESQSREEQPEIRHRTDGVDEAAKDIDSTDVAGRSEEEEENGYCGPDDHDEGSTDEKESNAAEVEENLPSDGLDATGNPLYEATPHEHGDDLFGGNDQAAGNLDAGAVRTTDHERDVVAAAAATECANAAQPHEEADEGYGDDFRDDGVERTGTGGDIVELTECVGEDASQQNDELQQSVIVVPDADEVQLGAISYSTSASNSESDDSSWQDAEEESGSSEHAGRETNESVQPTRETVFNEEGNYADEYEEGGEEFREEDFGEDDFDNSVEATLEDPTENRELSTGGEEDPENAQSNDEASRAVLEESEKFLASLENEEDIEATRLKASSSDNTETEGTEHSVPAEVLSGRPNVLHKNSSKRSLDDAELDGETLVTLSSSPDSKRTRTL